MSAFKKNQVLIHNTWGECVAVREWNERETVCLVCRTGRRHVLMNCFLQPLKGTGEHEGSICVIAEEDMAELETQMLAEYEERGGL